MQVSPAQGLADIGAERYVISACLVWPEDNLAKCLEAIGDRDPWTVTHHATIWRALRSMAESKTPIMPSEIVRVAKSPEGLPEYLDSLAVPVHGHYCEEYTKSILHLERRRLVCDKAKRLMHAASEGVVNGQLDELALAVKELESQDTYKPALAPITGFELYTQPPIAIDWIVKPILARQKLTQLQGEPKGGKSVFGFYSAIASALGYWMAGHFESCGKPVNVLFLSSEDASNILQQRLISYFNGFGVGKAEDLMRLITYPQETCATLGIELDTESGGKNLEELIKYVAADVVVLDSLANFNNAEENSKKEMQPVMTRLRRIALRTNTAFMYLHHVGKPQQGVNRSRQAKSRGSGAIAAAWDILIDWGDRGESNTTPISIMSKLGEEGEFDVDYLPQPDGSIRWRVGDKLPREDSKANMKKVMDALRELVKTNPGGVLAGTVATAAGITRECARGHLDIAFNEGQVSREKGDRNAWLYKPV